MLRAFAAIFTGLAIWLLVAPDLMHRPHWHPAKFDWKGIWHRRWPLLSGIGIAVIVTIFHGLLLGVAAGFPSGTALTIVRQYCVAHQATKRREQIAAACRTLTGLLQVGYLPQVALEKVAQDLPLFGEAAQISKLGGDGADIFLDQSRLPGAEYLRDLAAAWRLGQSSGASLSATLEALTTGLAADSAIAQVVAAELSAPRATGRLLAVLPVAGIGLGFTLGGDPVAFLTGSAVGQCVLAAGVVLACGGVLWTERIARV